MSEVEKWQRRFDRERAARREAERLLHDKSRALFVTNQALETKAEDLKDSLERLRSTQAKLVENEKLAALGGLVAGVAHEINTPLGVAVTAVSLSLEHINGLKAEMSAGTLTRGKMRQFMGELFETTSLASSNLRRSARLVQSFKSVAVDQSGERPRQVVIETLLHDVVTSLTATCRKAQISLTLDAPGETVVYCHAGALVQVITNLVQNAAVHGFAGVEQDHVVLLSMRVEQKSLVLTVADNGVGMDAETQRRVFEPFFTTRRSTGGSGLGMHICHTLVTQRFHGQIDVDSDLGKGTCWTIRIPMNTDGMCLLEKK